MGVPTCKMYHAFKDYIEVCEPKTKPADEAKAKTDKAEGKNAKNKSSYKEAKPLPFFGRPTFF